MFHRIQPLAAHVCRRKSRSDVQAFGLRSVHRGSLALSTRRVTSARQVGRQDWAFEVVCPPKMGASPATTESTKHLTVVWCGHGWRLVVVTSRSLGQTMRNYSPRRSAASNLGRRTSWLSLCICGMAPNILLAIASRPRTRPEACGKQPWRGKHRFCYPKTATHYLLGPTRRMARPAQRKTPQHCVPMVMTIQMGRSLGLIRAPMPALETLNAVRIRRLRGTQHSCDQTPHTNWKKLCQPPSTG